MSFCKIRETSLVSESVNFKDVLSWANIDMSHYLVCVCVCVCSGEKSSNCTARPVGDPFASSLSSPTYSLCRTL